MRRAPSLSLLTVVLGSLFALPASAGDGKAVARFLDERTVAVLRLEPGKVDLAAFLNPEILGVKPNDEVLASTKQEWGGWLKELRAAGATEMFLVASLADVPDVPPFVVVPLSKEADAKARPRILNRLAHFDSSLADPLAGERMPALDGPLAAERIGDALVWGGPRQRKRLRALEAVKRPVLLSALGDSGPARLVLVPTTDSARILEETIPALPEALGGGSIKVVSRGLKGIVIDLEAASKLQVKITILSADADAAIALDALLRKGLKSLAENTTVRAWLPAAGRLPALWKPRRVGNRLELRLDESALVEIGRPLVRWAVAEERQARASEQMRRLLQAILAYEVKNGSFPAQASHAKDGKPLLSWRVHLLPYLGETALYREFKLDEPWDSQHNIKLITRMPAVYRPLNATLAKEHRTTMLAPLGEATMFPSRGNVRITDVPDGTDTTIMLIDADDERAVVWTRPADLKYDAKDPFRGLSRRHDRRIMIGTVDGTVHFPAKTIDKATLSALFTRNGGETVEIP